MKNYSKMSDFEINELVAIALSLDYIIPTSPRPVIGAFNSNAAGYVIFDPCNSWSDAGEIIQEYGIELGYDGVSWEASCNLRGIKPYSDWKKYPESPCRLAMIVFLMMHDKGED